MSVRCYWEFHIKSLVVKPARKVGEVNLWLWDSGDRQGAGCCSGCFFDSRHSGRGFLNFPGNLCP